MLTTRAWAVEDHGGDLLDWGIETVRDVIELVAVILATGGVLVGVRAYVTSRHHLQFGVINSCVARFQALLPALATESACKSDDVRAYLDLCNEELFYVKHRYVPDEVAHEWIDGMLQMLPAIRSVDDEALEIWPERPGSLPGCEDLMRKFPRLCEAFTFRAPPDLRRPETRRPFIEGVVGRARNYRF